MSSRNCARHPGFRTRGHSVLLHQRRCVACYLLLETQHFVLTDLLALVGTVEELAASQATLFLVREQFETNYFTPVSIIKAVLPSMRKRMSGHIILLTSISKLLIPRYVHPADEKPSWPSRHARSGDVLCLRLGNRRFLRCEQPPSSSSKNVSHLYISSFAYVRICLLEPRLRDCPF